MSDFPIQINATSLFYRDFFLLLPGGGFSKTVSTKEVQMFQLAPGGHGFQFGSGMHADFSFRVTDNGNLNTAMIAAPF
jgi:hypothetical protein